MDPASIINSLFQQYLGRTPTAAEMSGFQSALSSGVTDATGLGLFLQGSSQYQQAQIPGQTQQFANTLSQNNSSILNQGFNQAQSQFAQNGRPNSTGLNSAFAQVAGNLANQQSPQVAQFQGQLQQNALNPNQYASQYMGAQQQGQQNQFTAQQNALQNQYYGQYFNQGLGQAQRNQQQLSGTALGGGLGSLLGAGIGGLVGGGLPGATLGAGLGKAAGGGLGSYF